MRRAVLLLALAMAAAPVVAQQDTKAPGFFDRLFGTDQADSDAEQGSLLEQLIEDSLSDAGRTVTVSGFSGALSGKATLDRLTIADAEGIWLTLEDAQLDWNRAALFSGRLEVAELTAARIDLPRLAIPSEDAAPTPEASGFSLPELPVSIDIGQIGAETVSIGAPVFGAAADVSVDGSFSLDNGQGSAELSVLRLDGQGAVTLDASYANTTQNLALDLSLQEDPNGIFANLVDLPGLPSVDFAIQSDAPLSDYTANIRLATDGAERLSGQIILQDIEGEQRITADIGGDIAPVFAPEYRAFFGDAVRLSTQALIAADGGISVPEFTLTAREIALNGALELRPDRVPETIALSGQIASQNGSPVLLPLKGAETRVDRADLRISFDASQSEDWTGQITLQGLDRDGLTADRAALKGSGRIVPSDPAEVTATFDFDTVNLDTGIPGLAQALGTNLKGSTKIGWRGGPIQVSGLNLTAQNLSARGQAEITLTDDGPQVLGDVELAATRLADFSTLANRALSGSAELASSFRAQPLAQIFDVRAKGTTFDATIGDDIADALLAGEALIDLQASRDEDGLRVELNRLASAAVDLAAKADLRSGGSTLDLDGQLTDTSILIQRLNGPSRITFDGREDENRDWAIQTRLDGPTFGATLDGTLADLFGLPAFTGKIGLTAEELSPFSDLAGRPLRGRLEVDANGNLNADLSQVALQAVLNGSGLSIGQAEADRLLAGNLTAEINATKTDDRIELEALELSTALLEANASGILANRDTQIAINAKLSEVASFVEGIAGPLSLTGTIGRDTPNLRFNLDATGPAGATATLRGTVAEDFSTANLGANGTAPLGLANRFIQPRSLSGTAAFDLRLNGAPALSNLSGQITTNGARLAAPTVGTALSNISGNVALSGGTARLDLSSPVQRGGRVTISGPVGMTAPNSADVAIRLSRLTLSDPRLYETTVDGNLSVSGPLTGGARISGGLTLGETNIRIPDSSFGGAGAVPEIIHLNEPPPVRGTRRRAGLLDTKTSGGGSGPTRSFPLDILVNAPNRIFVRGRGLDSEFGGRLRITGTTDNVIPQGAFELIRGRLDILGRRLTLENARITLRGGFVPYLELRASTDADEYRVNVDVEGQADAPEISFTSSPELPQEEVLSRLIFGRGLETLSPLQAARLALAVRTLAGQGGEGIVGRIRGGTGLADLDVTTTEDGNAAVRAGAYLGENVYSDVTVDSAGETKLNLNLDITPSLKARGGVSSDGDTSIGIFFERDY